MLKVILADDERIILEGIRRSIKWDDYHMEVVASAFNGRDALEQVKEYRPDVLITDIRMPFMSGLSLIEHAKSVCPDLIPVLISGYDDFSYVRSGLRLGVADYILKPVSLPQLEETLRKISLQLQERDKQSRHVRNTAEANFLRDIIYRNIPPEEVEEERNSREYSKKNYYCIVHAGLRESEGNQTRELKHFFECVSECAGEQGLLIISNDGEGYTLFISDDENKHLLLRMNLFMDHCIRKGSEKGLQIRFAVGRTFSELKDIRTSFSEVMGITDVFFIMPEQQILRFEEVEEYGDGSSLRRQLSDCSRKISENCIEGNLSKADEYVDRVDELIRSAPKSSKDNMEFFLTVYKVDLIRALEAISAEPLDYLLVPNPLREELAAGSSYKMTFLRLKKRLREIHESLSEKQERTPGQLIRRAMHYINSHSTDPTLSLDMVAEYAEMPPSRFSRLFKRENGVTYIQYLTAVRLKQAKDMLRSGDEKISQISVNVGFENPAYFISLFKRYEGMTPLEYRNQMHSEKG